MATPFNPELPVAADLATAKDILATGTAPEERSAPSQSSSGTNHPGEAPVLQNPRLQPPHMPSALPLKSPRSGDPSAVLPASSGAEQAGQSQSVQQERLRLVRMRLAPAEIERRAALSRLRKPRPGAFRGALPRHRKHIWRSWRATYDVLLCLVKGESPATVKPCSTFVMVLCRLFFGGRI